MPTILNTERIGQQSAARNVHFIIACKLLAETGKEAQKEATQLGKTEKYPLFLVIRSTAEQAAGIR